MRSKMLLNQRQALDWSETDSRNLHVQTERLPIDPSLEVHYNMNGARLYALFKLDELLAPVQPDNHMILLMNKLCEHGNALLYLAECNTKRIFCTGGNVVLPSQTVPQSEMTPYFTLYNVSGRKFRINIRAYNSEFCFTSLGVSFDRDLVNARDGVFTFLH